MTKQTWLEITLIVNGELAEAVAEVIARYAPNGVVIESTQIQDESNGPGHPTGPLRVCGYLPQDENIEETRQRLEEALGYLGMISPLPTPTYQPIQETNWMDAWKQHYRPIPVGERLVILPPWLENPNPERIPIKIDPGMAFGTGTHPTTQLSLQLLETYVKSNEPILDIGCGSGILSIAAVKLGASLAYGVDVDPASVENAQENAIQNNAQDATLFKVGSVAEVKVGELPIQKAPVVVANILAHILIRLLGEGMADLAAPGGVLLLSGILDEKEADILSGLEANQMVVVERLQMEDWVGLAAKKSR